MLARLASHLPSDFATILLPEAESVVARLGVRLPSWVIALGVIPVYDLNLAYPSNSLQAIRRGLIGYGNALIDLAVRVACFETLTSAEAEAISRASQQRNTAVSAWAGTLELEAVSRFSPSKSSAHEWKPIDALSILAAGVVHLEGFPALLDLLRAPMQVIDRQSQFLEAKTCLQEISQSRLRELPRYEVLLESGPDHLKHFEVAVSAGPYRAVGSGRSKKAAEQEAAKAFLGQMRTHSWLPTTINSRPQRSHKIPNIQLRRLHLAQEILDYDFRNLELLSAALIHSSFIFETRAQGTLLDYSPLAAVGGVLVEVLAYREFCNAPDLFEYSNALARGVSHCANKDTLASTPLACELAELSLVGKGQGKTGLSSRMRSDILQAALAAVLIDSENSLDTAPFRGLNQYFSRELHRSIGGRSPNVDAKTQLQEVLQAFGKPPTYSVEQVGPQHRLTFESRVQLLLAGESFSLSGRGASRRSSENDAARKCLEVFDITRGDLSESRLLRLSGDQRDLTRQFLKATITRLAEGGLAWVRVKKLEIHTINSIALNEGCDTTSALLSLRRICRSLEIEIPSDQWKGVFKAYPRKSAPSLAHAANLLRSLNSYSESLDPGELGPLPTEMDLFRHLRLLTAVLGVFSERRPALVNTSVLQEALTLMKSRHPGLRVTVSCQGAYWMDASLLEIANIIIGDLDPPGTTRDLCVDLSCNGTRVELRICLSKDFDSSTLPFDLAWLQSLVRELSTGLVVEQEGPSLLLHAPRIGEAGDGADRDWVEIALDELLAPSDRDRNLARRTAQLLHDLKNFLVAISSQMASGRSSKTLRYQSFASAEELLAQTLSHLSLALQWVGQPTHIELAALDLRRLLQAVVASFLATSPASVSLSTRLDAREVYIAGDEKLLAALFLNLLKNATEAMPEGGHLSFEWIYLEESSDVLVEIRDSGGGFSSAVLRALERGDLPDSSKRKGQGLGLASVQHLVDLHGGTISFGNTATGAIVTITLPADATPVHVEEI